MEKGTLEELKMLLNSILPDKNLVKLLIDLKTIQSKMVSIQDGIKILRNSGIYKEEDLRELFEIENLSSKWNNCCFDPGIHRSLSFYSGITLQGDFVLSDGEIQKEAFGGGGFTGMVESFGYYKPVYSFGLAFGVERLMKILNKS